MGMATREAYGEELAKLAAENPKIVVLDADLAGSTKTALTTSKPQPQKAPTKQKEEEPQPDAQQAPIFDTTQLSAEIASLEAQLAQEQQLYAKRPKIHRLNAASTMRDKGAWY